MLREVTATRYVTPLREGGSLPGLVEADDDGLYVVKFSGAGQGVKALVAELLVGQLGLAVGLPVPELVLADIDPELGRAEPDPEVAELIISSPGLNVGLDFLPGALEYTSGMAIGPEFAADVVWFDALTTNVDRTPRNPNLLVWHDRTWLIDHGAALYRQHAGLDPHADAPRPFPQIADHVLLGCAGSITAAHERMRARLDAAAIARAVALVPGDWLALEERDVYTAYLTARLEHGGFATEAEAARDRG